jgi:hypothetical protein
MIETSTAILRIHRQTRFAFGQPLLSVNGMQSMGSISAPSARFGAAPAILQGERMEEGGVIARSILQTSILFIGNEQRSNAQSLKVLTPCTSVQNVFERSQPNRGHSLVVIHHAVVRVVLQLVELVHRHQLHSIDPQFFQVR